MSRKVRTAEISIAVFAGFYIGVKVDSISHLSLIFISPKSMKGVN